MIVLDLETAEVNWTVRHPGKLGMAMEIVFGPDLRHGGEAAALVKELVLVLEKLDTCKARMEQGELRVDANISVRRQGEELGVRTEVKNLNSARSVARAIEYEVARQVMVLEQGGVVENETRSFDFGLNKTITMRDKEAKQDYRFMPEPNSLHSGNWEQQDMIKTSPIRSSMPELPGSVSCMVSVWGLHLSQWSGHNYWTTSYSVSPFPPMSHQLQGGVGLGDQMYLSDFYRL